MELRSLGCSLSRLRHPYVPISSFITPFFHSIFGYILSRFQSILFIDLILTLPPLYITFAQPNQPDPSATHFEMAIYLTGGTVIYTIIYVYTVYICVCICLQISWLVSTSTTSAAPV